MICINCLPHIPSAPLNRDLRHTDRRTSPLRSDKAQGIQAKANNISQNYLLSFEFLEVIQKLFTNWLAMEMQDGNQIKK
jgi:hypothetical protein